MAAKLIGPNLDLQFLKKIHFLDEVIIFDHLPCKGLIRVAVFVVYRTNVQSAKKLLSYFSLHFVHEKTDIQSDV